MENYYFDLSRLPEKFNNDAVKKFMEQHKFLVYEPLNAPKNKHIGSGAWHDDVIAFLEENAPVEAIPEVKDQLLSASTDQELSATVVPVEPVNSAHSFTEGSDVFVNTMPTFTVEPKKKKAAKKVAEAPNPTDNNGVA